MPAEVGQRISGFQSQSAIGKILVAKWRNMVEHAQTEKDQKEIQKSLRGFCPKRVLQFIRGLPHRHRQYIWKGRL